MSEELSLQINSVSASMEKAITHLESELVKMRVGRANPQMFDSVVVDYYGSPTAIAQVANISVFFPFLIFYLNKYQFIDNQTKTPTHFEVYEVLFP